MNDDNKIKIYSYSNSNIPFVLFIIIIIMTVNLIALICFTHTQNISQLKLKIDEKIKRGKQINLKYIEIIIIYLKIAFI